MSAGDPLRSVRVLAPAKVNPWLEVLDRRPDGFHEVETALLALDLADEVVVRARDGPPGEVRVVVTGPAASPDVPAGVRGGAENLAARGARAVLELAAGAGARPPALEVVLEKRVPSRAGLGGGSSDAAAAALATAHLVGVDPDDPALAAALGGIGADVPFFLAARRSGWAWCTGRGARVEPHSLAGAGDELAVALLMPELACPTAAVYAALGPLDGAPRRDFDPASWPPSALDEARASLFNRLEPAALRAVPGLAAWRAVLDGGGAKHFRLSGSGSSFFGLFAGREAAEAALEGLASEGKARDLGLRGRWVGRPTGHGVRTADSK